MAEHPAVRTVFVPYDSGRRGIRMGAGPGHLWENGLPQTLRSENRPELDFIDVVPEADPPAEVAVAFELDRLVSELDAHADFNTPETTTTGSTDGMGLAIAVGHCWEAMAGGVPGFFPVEEENVVLAGARALETPEVERLGASGVAVVGADRIRREGLYVLTLALDRLRERVGRVYVHLDLDVFDPTEVGTANGFAPEGGLTVRDLETALGMVRERFSVTAAGIASYDPSFDADGRVVAGALACVGILTAPDTCRA